MNTDSILTGMQLLGRIPDVISRAGSASLSEYVQEARVEPPVLVDSAAVSLPYLQDILHVANSLYSAYYLQAWSLSTATVNGVGVRQTLNSLNNRRRASTDAGALTGIVAGGLMASTEAFRYGLPDPEIEVISTEAKEFDDRSERRFGKDTMKGVTEAGNLAVGRIFDVEIREGGESIQVPVTIQLNTSVVQSDVLTHILNIDSEDRTAKARRHGFLSGRLKFLRDVVLNQDLIDRHKNALMKDTSGYYKELISKRRQNKLSAILSLTPSVATAATIVVITSDTLKQVEEAFGAKIDNQKMRDRLFRSTYTTLMFVVDTEWEQIDVYHRGIDRPTELTIRDLKSANRGSGPDVTEIMKAYQMGRSITV